MYRPSRALPYLLARLGVRMGELFARELKRDDLTLPMYRVLAFLAEENGVQRLGDLAVLTVMEMSTLSRLVATMQRRGLVTRVRPENDQRSLHVGLTDAGKVLVTRLQPRAHYYEQVATGALSAAEIDALKATLNVIYQNVDMLEAELDAWDAAEAAKPKARRKAASD
ncbi:MAG TPA: MarR family transcriptional regulator [Aliidongia sp.]|uniref:MarR family winged helix-turn-helix transcriptional regulator n=1 Tax=Aliidongia sp. TaxID=1914230 RepID=UPI002DDD7D4E|nr:MarR family transcriptional regulator [Aliidongia sp.]HEV2677401.1 MarR family transcriptional regulator [Aliidongia sp.]